MAQETANATLNVMQATTPTFVLSLPDTVDLSEAEHVYFTLSQDNYRSITKTGEDVVVEGNTVSVYLNQSETLKFRPNEYAALQLNWTYAGGGRASSQTVTIYVDENLLKEVVV
ncbi:MAG: hypothetical protein IJJ55_06140 [Clostridia bacterium]|nr:hypothetical protein [Clostridia bacterium]